MKILITGASGQLGTTLKENFQDFQDFHIYTPDRNEFNLLNKEQVIENYIYELDPDWIINCAAYTAVDKAEEEPDIAYKINALKKFVSLKMGELEKIESLEQLRALDNGININVALSKSHTIGVDTQEDFVAIKKIMEYKP